VNGIPLYSKQGTDFVHSAVPSIKLNAAQHASYKHYQANTFYAYEQHLLDSLGLFRGGITTSEPDPDWEYIDYLHRTLRINSDEKTAYWSPFTIEAKPIDLDVSHVRTMNGYSQLAGFSQAESSFVQSLKLYRRARAGKVVGTAVMAAGGFMIVGVTPLMANAGTKEDMRKSSAIGLAGVAVGALFFGISSGIESRAQLPFNQGIWEYDVALRKQYHIPDFEK